MAEQAVKVEAIGPLNGLRVLVVEDDFLILMELEAVLADAGVCEAVLCRSVPEALAAVDDDIDAAILDMRLGPDSVAPVAHELSRRGTPFLFYTGQAANDPELAIWPGNKVISKPAAPQTIVAAVRNLLKQ